MGDSLPHNTTPGKEKNQMRKTYCLPFMVLWVIALIMVAPAPGAAAEKTWTIRFHYEQPTDRPPSRIRL